jgi:integrase/recombinase XerC
MKKGKLSVAAGEKACEICGDELPALEYCPGKKHFVCSKRECRHRIFEIDRKTVRVNAGEKTCDRPGCSKPVPEGLYYDLRRKFFCSDECEKKVYQTGSAEVQCDYCGKTIKTYPCLIDGGHYCDQKEFGKHLRELNNKARAGRFTKILIEYTEQSCPPHYKARSIINVRSDLLLFFEFLNLEGIKSLEKVDPRLVTKFITWSNHRGATPNRAVRFLVRFFNWMIVEGRRKKPNPIVPNFHKQTSGKRLPRPYTDEELEFIWHLLQERGDTQAKLAVAIGEETGARVGELSRLRLEDVDLRGQQVFIRLPNKTDTERWAPFHEKTKYYLGQWLAERDPACGHNFLLYNSLKRPPSIAQIQLKLRAILCTRSRNETHEYGLKSFSFHRLRHAMASRLGNSGADAATIMAIGGWKKFESMQQYVQLKPTTVRRDYDAAMAKIAQAAKEEAPITQSLEDFARSGVPSLEPDSQSVT